MIHYTKFSQSTKASSLDSSQHLAAPIVKKQIIRPREEQKNVIFHPSHKSRYKSQHDFHSPGQLKRQNVNWIIYNILVSIFKNWLRLAPFIMHLLKATYSDKIADLETLIRRVEEQEKRLQRNLQKMSTNYKKGHLRVFSDFHKQRKDQEEQNFHNKAIDEAMDLLPKMQLNTQLINGYTLGNNRWLVTAKENQLARDLLKKNQTRPTNEFMYVTMALKNLAETLIERFQFVKYLKQNKLKVEEEITQPLIRLFEMDSEFNVEENLKTQKIIDSIKANIHYQSSQATDRTQIQDNGKKTFNFIFSQPPQHHDNGTISEQEQKLGEKENVAAQKRNKSKIHHLSGEDFIDEARLRDIALKSQKHILEGDNRSRKKIGFIYEDNIIHPQTISKSHAMKKTKIEKYTERKVVLNRQKINKRHLEIPLQKQFDGKKKFSRHNTKEQLSSKKDLDKKSQTKQNRKLKYNSTAGKTSFRVSSSIQSEHEGLKNFRKMGTSQFRKGKGRMNSKMSGNEDSIDDESQSEDNFFKINKMLKPGRLRRKHPKVLTSDLTEKLSLETLDKQLMKEGNVVHKKKKILTFINKLEAQGLLNHDETKKVLLMAKKLKNNNSKTLKRYTERSSGLSFEERNKNIGKSQHSPAYQVDLASLYKYLNEFQKEALDSLLKVPPKEFDENMELITYRRGSGMEVELHEEKVERKSTAYNYRWFQKQSKALRLSLALIRGMSQEFCQKNFP